MLNTLMNTEMMKMMNTPLTKKMLEKKTHQEADKIMTFYNSNSNLALYIGSIKETNEGTKARSWNLILKRLAKHDFFTGVATFQPSFAQLFEFLKSETKELKYSPVEEWKRLCKAWLFSNYNSEKEIDCDFHFSNYYKCLTYGNTGTQVSNFTFGMLIPSIKANVLVPITNVHLLKHIDQSQIKTNLTCLIEDYGINFNGIEYETCRNFPKFPIKFGNNKSLFIGGDNDFISFLSPTKEIKESLVEQLRNDSFYKYIDADDIEVEVNGQIFHYTYAITPNYSNYLFELYSPDFPDLV
ncbi:hypothetical protein ABC382_00825 [Lysinibacillus sp. 1P01SD]|uniref:hypothetical protein n=1 Tax=Lysinibacillus sp. 1P01SD TaxID=3132285 RepID=UPI00399FFE66